MHLQLRIRRRLYNFCMLTGGYSVKQHLLASYLDALGSVVVAQAFKGKAMDGGLSGIRKLAKMPDVCKLLKSNGTLCPKSGSSRRILGEFLITDELVSLQLQACCSSLHVGRIETSKTHNRQHGHSQDQTCNACHMVQEWTFLFSSSKRPWT